MNTLEGRRRLIDNFINSVVVYDDYILITFNYKDDAKTITFKEIESSDLSSLGGPKNAQKILYSCGFPQFKGFFAFFEKPSKLLQVDKKGDNLQESRKNHCLSFEKDGMKMAIIQAKEKDGKTVSYKFKACLGRDKDGKQIFKCITWYPPENLTLAKILKAAKPDAILTVFCCAVLP